MDFNNGDVLFFKTDMSDNAQRFIVTNNDLGNENFIEVGWFNEVTRTIIGGRFLKILFVKA